MRRVIIGFKPPLDFGEVISTNQLSEAFHVGNMGGMRQSERTGTLALISDNTKGLYRDAWDDGFLNAWGRSAIKSLVAFKDQ